MNHLSRRHFTWVGLTEASDGLLWRWSLVVASREEKERVRDLGKPRQDWGGILNEWVGVSRKGIMQKGELFISLSSLWAIVAGWIMYSIISQVPNESPWGQDRSCIMRIARHIVVVTPIFRHILWSCLILAPPHIIPVSRDLVLFTLSQSSSYPFRLFVCESKIWIVMNSIER